jgi:hypothetical protein
MQVEAIYNQGRLQFNAPINFANNFFKVRVEIPDNEIVTSAQEQSTNNTPSARLDAIIGRAFRQANRGKPSINAKALWHAHLEEKYLGR